MTWMCSVCGYTYDGDDFAKEAMDYQCPLCDSGKEQFQQRDIAAEIKNATEQFLNTNKDK